MESYDNDPGLCAALYTPVWSIQLNERHACKHAKYNRAASVEEQLRIKPVNVVTFYDGQSC